jgi:hypothetical protein
MTAALGLDDPQVTVVDRFCVVPSEYVPIAMYCCLPLWNPNRPVLNGMVAFAGVTATDCSATLDPVSCAVHEIPLGATAVMVVDPTPAIVAIPLEPAALLMVATADEDEDQVTADVRSAVKPFE